MNNFLCFITYGAFGCPDVEAGQRWIDDCALDDSQNPFVKRDRLPIVIVDEVIGKWVRYHPYTLTVREMSCTINHFRIYRTLLKEENTND